MNIRDDIKAAKAIGSKDYDTAIGIYRKRVEGDEKDSCSLAMLAHCYEWKGDVGSAIEYANRVLVADPTDFSMLLLAARYWSAKHDEDRTYHYACRALDNPPNTNPEIPKWVFWILKPLYIFKKFRNFEEKCRKDFEKDENKDKENLDWAREYKRRYEARYGGDEKKFVH